MKVLFVYPVPPVRFQMLRYQQGIGSLSAVLKQAGHTTELLVLPGSEPEQLDEAVRRFQPGLVALSLTSGFFDVGCAVARRAATEHKLPVLLGGVHPTLRPEESIAAEGVLAICIGEGEYPLLELCAALDAGRDPTAIRNLWIKQGDRVHRNPLRPLIEDLDTLPFPDRELFHFEELVRSFPEAEFMGSRGCPFQCAYCVNHALIELYRGLGTYVRYRSVDNLLAEVAAVLQHYPVPHEIVGFHDDTFTLNPRWLREFAEKYPARCKLPFWCNATARSINAEVVELLKRAGCYEVRLGLESGNDHLRREVLKKNVTREEIVRAFRLLHEAGIKAWAFNMVGLPYETPATIRDTIRLNHLVRPDSTFCSIFQPYAGTDLETLCREQGWTTGKTVRSYFENDYALNQPTISREEVVFFHDVFRDLVRWPWAEGLIRFLHRIPVTRTKSVWNLFRRVRTKSREAWGRITGEPVNPE